MRRAVRMISNFRSGSVSKRRQRSRSLPSAFDPRALEPNKRIEEGFISSLSRLATAFAASLVFRLILHSSHKHQVCPFASHFILPLGPCGRRSRWRTPGGKPGWLGARAFLCRTYKGNPRTTSGLHRNCHGGYDDRSRWYSLR